MDKYQHYLPQCYLRNFSSHRKGVFVFDKTLNKSYIGSIKRIASEKNFYRIDKSIVEHITEPQDVTEDYFEDYFANNIEGPYSRLLSQIISSSEDFIKDENTNPVLSEEDMNCFAWMIAHQYLRMPDVREEYVDAERKKTNAEIDIVKSFLKISKPEWKDAIDEIKISYNEAYNTIVHSQLFFNEDLLLNIQASILDKIWIFYVSPTKEFYTSDNPIIIYPHLSSRKPLMGGFDMQGVEVTFPIGPTVLLSLLDAEHFKTEAHRNNKFQRISQKSKDRYTILQYFSGNRYVFSSLNDFRKIEFMRKHNTPEKHYLPKERILVNGK